MSDDNDEAVAQALKDLQDKLNETEPCWNPNDPDVAELYMGSWTSRGVSKSTAESMCTNEDGTECHVKNQCALYAMLAQEPYGIWGKTRPVDRGIPKRFKGYY